MGHASFFFLRAGLYLRRLVLSFNRLTFHEVARLLADFRAYHSAGTPALAAIPDKGVAPAATTKAMPRGETEGSP